MQIQLVLGLLCLFGAVSAADSKNSQLLNHLKNESLAISQKAQQALHQFKQDGYGNLTQALQFQIGLVEKLLVKVKQAGVHTTFTAINKHILEEAVMHRAHRMDEEIDVIKQAIATKNNPHRNPETFTAEYNIMQLKTMIKKIKEFYQKDAPHSIYEAIVKHEEIEMIKLVKELEETKPTGEHLKRLELQANRHDLTQNNLGSYRLKAMITDEFFN